MALRRSQISIILMVATALALGGCETLNSLNPFGGGGERKEKTKAEKYDDRPLVHKTGEIPPDTVNRSYTDEDLRGE